MISVHHRLLALNVVADWCMYVLSSVEFVVFNVGILCLDRVMLISTKFKVKNRQKEMITRIRVIPCQLTQNPEPVHVLLCVL